MLSSSCLFCSDGLSLFVIQAYKHTIQALAYSLILRPRLTVGYFPVDVFGIAEN